jgi:hypothetical protein
MTNSRIRSTESKKEPKKRIRQPIESQLTQKPIRRSRNRRRKKRGKLLKNRRG